MNVTFISPCIDVPDTRAWDIATYMASPRIAVDTNHIGAGTRA